MILSGNLSEVPAAIDLEYGFCKYEFEVTNGASGYPQFVTVKSWKFNGFSRAASDIGKQEILPGPQQRRIPLKCCFDRRFLIGSISYSELFICSCTDSVSGSGVGSGVGSSEGSGVGSSSAFGASLIRNVLFISRSTSFFVPSAVR